MNPVWLVRSRQMATRFRFWIVLSGYDPRDKSFTHKLYLVYASVFWSIWILAMLGLAAGGVAGIFQLINPGHVTDTAVLMGGLCLTLWAVYSAYQAARRSPIVFSEDDAYLICQTPVDRRQVTLAWLVGDWPYSGIPFWVLGATLGFTMIEARANGLTTVVDYISSALVCLSILIPLHLGLLASIWAFGASRLQGEKEKVGLARFPIIIALFILVAWMLRLGWFGLPGWIAYPFEAGLNLLLLPIQASLGSANWLVGELLSFGWVTVGFACLIWQSNDFNLNRAAQETSVYMAYRNAINSLNQDAANEIAMMQKLGAQRSPIQFQLPSGASALVWKDIVQSLRSLQLSAIFPWAQMLAAALGVFLARDWGLRLAAMFLWMLFSNQIFSQRLRQDLRNWAIFTQFPFEPMRIMLMEISMPVAGSMLINWLGLWLAGRSFSLFQPLGMAILIPGLTLGMALVTTWDILRQCESDALLTGVVPGVDIWSFVVGGIVLLTPFAFFSLISRSDSFPQSPYLGAFFLNLCLLVILGRLVSDTYRKIK